MAKEEKLSEEHLAAWRSLLKVHATLIERIDHELAAAGRVPLSSYDVLIELYEAPERRLRMHELARRVVLSRSGLTRLVDRLETEGFLRRDRNVADRRGAYAVITEEGIEALRRAWPTYAHGLARHFAASLTLEEARTLSTAFERMLQEQSANGAPDATRHPQRTPID